MKQDDETTAQATPYRPPPAVVSPDEDLARAVLRPEVSSHADLLWVGRPVRGLRLQASDVIGIPFSLLWGGFAIFWETTVILAHAPIFMKLWGIPFVVVGQYIIWGRFFVDAWKRARTFYGLTQDRAIIVTLGRTRKVETVLLRAEPQIELEERSSGRGTIRFGRAIKGPGRRMAVQPPMFDSIEKAREVYARIQESIGR